MRKLPDVQAIPAGHVIHGKEIRTSCGFIPLPLRLAVRLNLLQPSQLPLKLQSIELLLRVVSQGEVQWTAVHVEQLIYLFWRQRFLQSLDEVLVVHRAVSAISKHARKVTWLRNVELADSLATPIYPLLSGLLPLAWLKWHCHLMLSTRSIPSLVTTKVQIQWATRRVEVARVDSALPVSKPVSLPKVVDLATSSSGVNNAIMMRVLPGQQTFLEELVDGFQHVHVASAQLGNALIPYKHRVLLKLSLLLVLLLMNSEFLSREHE
mmetsp:Transcript_64233/g.153181  ORF Transcript_64233/g.153181 Transcript_64233/m.153181 type:complete len:265 (-) Transcript_64233:241-1035(-)